MLQHIRKSPLLLVALASIGSVPIVAIVLAGGVSGISALAPVESLASLLSARSPGHRTTAQLNKTKRAKLAKITPRQRALPKVRPAPPPPDQFGNILLGTPAPILEIAPPIETAFLPPPNLPPIVPPIIGIVPSCVGCGPSGNPPPPPPPPPPVSPVPEPSTWAMLLLGFFGGGYMLRRRPRHGLQAAS